MNTSPWSVAPILGVNRVRAAAEHYRDVLGFEIDPVRGVFQPVPCEPDGVYAILTRDGAAVHLQIRRFRESRPSRPLLERDVYLFVDGVDALHDDLVRRGARIISPPAMAPHGLREFVVEDLDGNRLAFGERPGHHA